MKSVELIAISWYLNLFYAILIYLQSVEVWS